MSDEKTEGELYQKIKESLQEDFDDGGNTFFYVDRKEDLTKLLDEAKADFPFRIYFDNHLDDQNHYSFFSKAEIAKNPETYPASEDEVLRGVAEWLERQFFGVKPKNGLYCVTGSDKLAP